MNFTDYLALPAASWSGLKQLRESPAHYKHYVTSPSKPPTAAMILGTATHLAVLEPDRFESEVAVWTGGRRGTNAHKAWVQDNVGKTHLNEKEHALACAMAAAVHRNEDAMVLLEKGQSEVTLQWKDPATGIACKGRADWLDTGIMTDLKSTRCSCPRRFETQAAQLGYHCQLAHYRAGVGALTRVVPNVYLIVVESEPPHDVVVHHIPEDVLERGAEVVSELMALLRKCKGSGEWPGRVHGVREMGLPGWAWGEDSDEEAVSITFGEE